VIAFPPPGKHLKRALIGLVLAYLLTHSLFASATHALVLDSARVSQGEIWRILSYALLHDAPFHLISNLLLFYFFGLELERYGGPRLFWRAVLYGACGGALAVLLTAWVGGAPQLVIGASAAGFTLLTLWCLRFATRTILLFGMLPLTGQQILLLTIGYELILSVSAGATSTAAHFGGIATGFLLSGSPRRWWLRRKLGRVRQDMRRNTLRVVEGGRKPDDKPPGKGWLN
jgi:membrane associated rhomboid family serine protease